MCLIQAEQSSAGGGGNFAGTGWHFMLGLSCLLCTESRWDRRWVGVGVGWDGVEAWGPGRPRFRGGRRRERGSLMSCVVGREADQGSCQDRGPGSSGRLGGPFEGC